MYLNLHLLRALAALAVVYYHTTSEAGLNLPPAIGSHAVDVFFVISGFIIARSAVGSSKRFLLRRIIRIAPLYWIATLVVFGLALFRPQILHNTRADYRQLLCSLLFIPYDTPQAGTLPTLILGWSLNYEMYFYLVFAIALAAVPRFASLVCSLVIVAVAATISLTKISRPDVVFYARPLVFEFVYGICAYHLIAAWEPRHDWFLSRPRLRWALWGAAVASACAIGLEEAHSGFGVPRFIAAGVPAFVLVVSVVLMERTYGDCMRSPTMLLVGDSSYVLYLIHPYIVFGLLRTTRIEHTPLPWLASALVVVALLAATVISIAIHVFIEKPTTDRLRRWLLFGIEATAAQDDSDGVRVRDNSSNFLSRRASHAGVNAALRHGLSEGRG